MAERLKAHAWKVCRGLKPLASSNLAPSARKDAPERELFFGGRSGNVTSGREFGRLADDAAGRTAEAPLEGKQPKDGYQPRRLTPEKMLPKGGLFFGGRNGNVTSRRKFGRLADDAAGRHLPAVISHRNSANV